MSASFKKVSTKRLRKIIKQKHKVEKYTLNNKEYQVTLRKSY